MLNNTILIYILIIVIAEAIAQTCLKNYSNSKKFIYFFAGLIFYGLVAWALCQSYNINGGVGFVNLIWSALSIISSFTIGILFFKEVIHFHDIIAIILISIGVLILKFTN
jgi:multidrug transporter EmrE-like cation transporter